MRPLTGKLKTAGDHLMPLQQQQYNGLARTADYSIFLHWNGLAGLRAPAGESTLA